MRITLEPAYILHTRPFRDTSALVDLFTRNHGRVSVVARGAKASRSQFRGLLRPFTLVLASYSGKTDLKTLSKVEFSGGVIDFQNRALLSGFYLNELLVRLLQKEDPHPVLFDHYQQTLIRLFQQQPVEVCLRYFEWQLLSELGYAVDLTRDVEGLPINPQAYYQLNPTRGFIQTMDAHGASCGQHILDFARQSLSTPEQLQTIKRLCRVAISVLLGDKPIHSRTLFSNQNG